MNRVEVQFLGCGDALGSGGRFHTCFHVRYGAGQLLVDCGGSSLIAMKRFGVDPGLVDMIVVSHLHGDHFGGLPFFVLDAQFSCRTRPLIIAGPPGLESRLGEAMEVLFPGSTGVRRDVAVGFVEFKDRIQTTLGPVGVTPYAVVHPSGAPSYALRWECEGRLMGYSGDTEWTEALVEVARGTDLFICEAYFFDKEIKYHLSYRKLVEHRTRLECRRLILTHMSEDMLGHLQGVEVEVAEDGKRIVL